MNIEEVNKLKNLIIKAAKEYHDKDISQEDIRADSSLSSLGLDSLDAVEILLLIESSFDIDLSSIKDFQATETFSDFCSLIENARQENSQ